MADYKDIAGRIRTTAADGIVVESQEIIDLQNNKTQQEINSDVQTELGDRYTKEETYSKEQLDDLITTPDVNYVSVVATDTTTAVTDILPATGEANTIYRVGNWNGTQYDTTMYALFAWNGTTYVCLAARSFVGEVYDISANHPDGQGNPTEYADLAAALGTDGVNVPAGIRRGGMSVKFVCSSDNDYVQYRYMSTSTANADIANVANWQGVDEEPAAGSDNLVTSGGSALSISKAIATLTGIYLINTEEGVYYGNDSKKHKLNAYSINFYGLCDVLSVHIKASIGYAAYILFFDEDNNVLSSYQGNSGSGINVDTDINVPQTCAYFGVSYVNSYPCKVTSSSVIGKITKELNEASTTANRISEELYGDIVLVNTEEGVYLTSDGTKASMSAYSINNYKLNTSDISSVHIKASIGYVAYILFFDEDNNVLSSYHGSSSSGINIDLDYSIPEGCTHFAVSYVNSYPCKVTSNANNTGLVDDVSDLSEKYNSLFEELYGDIVLVNTEEGVYYGNDNNKHELNPYSINNYKLNTSDISSVHIKASIGYSAYILFFDEDNNVLSSYHGSSSSGINIDLDYSIPEGCTHFAVSYVNSYPCKVTSNNQGLLGEVDDIEEWIDEQKNLHIKIGLLGDSIAAGGSASSGKGFINIAASILGATVKNAAIAGWNLGDNGNRSIYKQVNGVSPATTSLDGDEDLIVIFAGTNDFGSAFPIGSAYTVNETTGHKTPSTDATTTCGGLVKTIQTLYEKYNGYIPIIICTPLQRSLAGAYSSGGSWDKNNIDKYMDDYIDAIYSVANYYGIPVADFYHNNMNPNIAGANTLYFADGLHPNTEGHRLIGTRLARIIKEKFIL